ncbi:MAG TPA: TonB-dependent receptor plug domain-containing protein, partial [Polyangia bacterium]|nr:TonB-dependent receptor plug domain-containing protein [Polyangia bacterium]
PAGHGFDEAASEAARRFSFQPARRDGVPIPSIVQFTYEFHLPVAALASPTASPPADGGPGQSTVVLASRPISAASSLSVQDRDFALRPIGSVQDILRVTPGLVMVQHSGGGKANQYFLRGFDADHGTDLALSIDGVPINLVSHAHGQGFADTNFIIPEAIERVEITKGPYFVQQGDFATAGAVNLVSREEFEHSAAGAGFVASPGHGSAGYRGLIIASPRFDTKIDGKAASLPIKAIFAADVGRTNGPFDNPEGWDRYKLLNKLTVNATPQSTFSLTEMSYAANWHGSGQLPRRAIDQGAVSRFGSLDPDEGGNTARHQLALQYRIRPSDTSELRATAYAVSYRFNLFSNFTLFLRDPVNGDEIQQVDRRTFYGGRASYRLRRTLGPVTVDSTVGADGRSDDIHEELWNTVHRQPITAVRASDVHESFVGAFINEELIPARWLRAEVGGRADLVSFAVDNRLPTADPAARGSGVGSAHQLSPKASLIVTPLDRPGAELDLYANYGHGFHSNDVRGAFTAPAVTPLVRAVGAEVGARTRLAQRLDLAVALWRLDLDSETVWNGDAGTTEPSAPTTRQGVELETRYEVTPWLAVDGQWSLTRSRFSTDGANGGGLALAPRQTWAGGLSGRHPLKAGIARAGLRFFGIGDRPATEDGALVAPGFTQVDLHLGYRHRRFDVALDIENLLDGQFRAAQFATVSRLSGEPLPGQPVPDGFGCGKNARVAGPPAGGPPDGLFHGCQDVSFTPAYPLTVRLMATLFLD